MKINENPRLARDGRATVGPGSGANYPIAGKSTTRAPAGPEEAKSRLLTPRDLAEGGRALYIAAQRTGNAKRGDPMTTFDERKDAYERKFALDEELRFKATARRNKLLGLGAAGELGKTGADADAYATSVVMADFEEAGEDDVLRKVRTDFEAAGKSGLEAEIRSRMLELMARAVEDVKAGR